MRMLTVNMQPSRIQPLQNLTGKSSFLNQPLKNDTVRFGSAVPTDVLNKLVNDYYYSLDPSYSDTLAKVSDPKLRIHIQTIAQALKKLPSADEGADVSLVFTPLVIPIFIHMAFRQKRASLFKQILQTLQAIPDETVRHAWIKRMTGFTGYSRIQREAFKAVSLLSEGPLRDEIIEIACRSQNVNHRKMGIAMLAMISNPELKTALVTALSVDPKKQIREMVADPTQAASSIQLYEPVKNLKLPALSSGNMQSLHPSVQQKIDNLSKDMEDRLNHYAQHNEIVKKALIEEFGSKAQFPKAADFKRQFYRISLNHLKSKQSPLKKLWGSNPKEQDVVGFAIRLMEMANKTGALILKNNAEQFVSQMEEIDKHQGKLEKDLTEARNIVTQQAMLNAQAELDYQLKEVQIAQLKKELATNLDQKSEMEQLKLKHQISNEERLLAEIGKRKTMMATSCAVAQAHVEALNSRMSTLTQQLGTALQFALLQQSRGKLQALMEKKDNTVPNVQLQAIIDKADEQKFVLQAEQDRSLGNHLEEEPAKPETVKKARLEAR